MKRFTLLAFILTAALCIPFAASAEDGNSETSATPETVTESEMAFETVQETEPSDPAEDAETEVQDEAGTAEDVGEQETEETNPAEEPSDFFVDLESDPIEETPEEDAEKTGQEPAYTEEEPMEVLETEEEKEKQQELDTARAESKDKTDGIVPVANSIWIETVVHPCKGHPLSAKKYGRFKGLTDFTFFTAQESGSYSAYTAGDGMVVLGKYQFTDFGAQGNGTATALVAYMNANCSEEVWDLYSALYQAFVVEKRNAVVEWNACAWNDTENFMAMQDQFAYEHYYVRGEAAVEAAGISLQNRPWVVKGMCFSIFNALGPYDEYGSGAYAITTAGIREKDSNAVFIEKICANMVSLYAGRYTWMYGRYGDGSNTAIGISDKDLALEILNGGLFEDEEPVTESLWKVTIRDKDSIAGPKGRICARNIQVKAKKVREYTDETEKKVLKISRDYTISTKVNKNHTKLTLVISGKGRYKGQELKKTISLPAVQPEEQ